jgi:hypothetical protein
MFMLTPIVVLSLTGFFVIVITCLARSTTKQTSDFVWTQFSNESGWPAGISFLAGMISPNYMVSSREHMHSVHTANEISMQELTAQFIWRKSAKSLQKSCQGR